MPNRTTPPLPELLAPAGSPEALDAAIAAGADAVYLGGSRHNARMNAHNFDAAALGEAGTHAHRMGARVYLTLNTLIYDRELPSALDAAYEAAVAGVDGLIIADLGAAALIRRALPNLPLHASTQLSGHSRDAGRVLAPFGFSRFVIARETSLDDLATAVRENPLEVEVFIHGALCVSHSGQCLFSSLVGGRSGNRGECAQPCRLPYAAQGCDGCASRDRRQNGKKPKTDKENYPLSLKDLTLASHLPALIDAGVASLKIEGRMKSPAYVGGVVSIWRRLLDERRAATPDEITLLSDLFSRDGFTDGYQVRKIDERMLGVRSEDDKERTAAAERKSAQLLRDARGAGALPLTLTLDAKADEPVTLSATAPLYRQGSTENATAGLTGDTPDVATNPAAALTPEAAEKQLSKTGGTPYRVAACNTDLGDRLLLPLSRLNALRREALDKLESARMDAMPDPTEGYVPTEPDAVAEELRTAVLAKSAASAPRLTARFHHPRQITAAARSYFDLMFLPLPHRRAASDLDAKQAGVILPPVIFDREAEAVEAALAESLVSGVHHLLVGNIGHLPLVRRAAERAGIPRDEIVLHGDFRLNVTNTLSALRQLGLGFSDLILSPELTLPRLRDISIALTEGELPSRAGAIVYGRIPLMLLEKCAIRAVCRHLPPSTVCRTVCARDTAVMYDRMGKAFPILRESGADDAEHRNVVCNSLPVGMSDRADDLDRSAIGHRHFLFTTESPDEVDRVIAAYRDRRPLGGEVRRIR